MILDDLPIKVRVIPPITIDSGKLTSSTAADVGPGETAWTAGTYAAGDVRTKDGRKWMSLEGSNTATPGTDATKWEDIGPTNKWAMFDLRTNEPTVQASPLTVVIAPGQRVNSIGLTGLVGATSVTITLEVASVVKYTTTLDLSARDVTGWYTYFFEPFATRGSVARFDIPPYVDAVITVTLEGAGEVECGALVLGNNEVLGSCERQARVSGLNFSSVARDFDGGINTLTQRRSVPKVAMRIFLEKARVKRVLPLKDDLNAQPAFWVGIDEDTHDYYEALQLVGFYRAFDLSLDESEFAYLDLELEAI